MKIQDKIVKNIAKKIAYLYNNPIHRGICFYKRCLYSSIIENRLNGAEGVAYASDIFLIRIKGEKYIKVGKGFTCREGLRLEAIDEYNGQIFSPQIIIHDNVDVGQGCHIGAINYVEIGENVLMGSKVYISDHEHGELKAEEMKIPPIKRPLYSKGVVKIGRNVWVGDGVVILPGVEIGEGAVIGANAVVTKNVPPRCVAAGVPAKVIRTID